MDLKNHLKLGACRNQLAHRDCWWGSLLAISWPKKLTAVDGVHPLQNTRVEISSSFLSSS